MYKSWCDITNISVLGTVSSQPKTDSMDINLDTCDLPPSWNHETQEIQQDYLLDYYSRRFRRSRKRLKVDPLPKRMDKQFSLEVLHKNE
ncbi:unnamed protein product [Hymenolepis diminuta]|uniref:Uncharacterized protein n=1 Tax=Hymenolepis diminuta TaxID=6216 RepID=A0A564YR61_HYMDI|nr:unnamed protein product [Hymenolepis diminuta]